MRSAFVLNADDERHFLTLPSFRVGFGSCERGTGRRPEIVSGTLKTRGTQQRRSGPLPGNREKNNLLTFGVGWVPLQ